MCGWLDLELGVILKDKSGSISFANVVSIVDCLPIENLATK